jgi:putative membrane-bound dehydrogenase-like protein
MIRRLSLVALLGLASSTYAFPDADHPLPPHEAAVSMTLPAGFKATLFAGEPDVVQPIAFCFDDRGRLWVCECRSYPKWIKDGSPGEDRILIFEDSKNTGTFDKRTVFADKLANLSSIEFGFGGVYVTCAPNLLHIPIDPKTDRPAGPPTVLLDGWSLNTQHNIVNGLKWGPDGWLYGCHGILATSKVGVPGTPDAQRTPINCGVWRFHPVTKKFEVVATGTTNPWGIDWDEHGELYLTNCVIEHAFHIVPGGHYKRMYGNDFDPNLYKLMGSAVDHLHWGGGDWTTSRGGKGIHSAPGGGHAHSGCMIYLGDNFPKEYRNNLFTCNIHGNRVNRDRIDDTAKGPVLRHEKDFLMANDTWFRGIAINYGPDGGVYVSDWCDTGECHNYQVVDKTNGRIYKVVYGNDQLAKAPVRVPSAERWAESDCWHDEWQSRHVRRLIQEQVAAGTMSPRQVRTEALRALASLKHEPEHGKFDSNEPVAALRLLRIGQAVDAWTETDCFEMLEKSVDPHIRALGWTMLPERDDTLEKAWGKHLAKADRLSRVVAASRLRTMSDEVRWHFATTLSWHGEDADDPELPLLLWYGIEPLLTTHPARTAIFLKGSRIPLIREFIARRIASMPEGGRKSAFFDVLVELGAVSSADIQRDVLRGVQAAFAGRRDQPMPDGWREDYPLFAKSESAEVRDLSLELAVLFGDVRALDSLKKLVLDGSADRVRREKGLSSLVHKMPAGLRDTLDPLLEDIALRSAAIKALARFDDAKIPPRLLGLYDKLPADEREDVRQTLASRPTFALALLNAVARKQIDSKDLSTVIVRQMLALKNKQVSDRVEEVWGTIRPVAERKAELTKKYRNLLTAESIKTADAVKGKALFTKNCASCHKLFGEGGTVGPDLTGSQRANLEYLLENVLDPSAIVAKEFQATVIATTAGRTITGIVKAESDKTLTIQTANETLTLPKDEIEARVQSKMSMMPEGILEQMPIDEVRALVAYLGRPTPIEAKGK